MQDKAQEKSLQDLQAEWNPDWKLMGQGDAGHHGCDGEDGIAGRTLDNL